MIKSLLWPPFCYFIPPYPPRAFGRGARGRRSNPAASAFYGLEDQRLRRDAFNLYYGCLRKTPYRWLDLAKLSAKILPRNEVHRIRYFTALVTPRPSDPQQRNRQEIYLRALRTLPNLSVHTGRYLASKVRMKRADGLGTVEVLKSEEKGSDVNLASYLLIDAYRSDCDVAVIVSNDSDLVFPIEHIKQQVGKVIGILNPRPRPSRELFPLANFYRQIRSSVLANSEFPESLQDAQGEFHKPLSW